VTFNEKAVLEVRKDAGLKTQKPQVQEDIQFEVEHPELKKSEKGDSSDKDSEDHDECSGPQPQSQRQTQVQGYQLTKDREKRQIKPPQRYGYADLIAYALAASHNIDVDEPKSYAEAVQSSNKSEWQEAMNDEIASLKKDHTWILIEKPGKEGQWVTSGFSESKKASQLVNLAGTKLGWWLRGTLKGKELTLKRYSPMWLDMPP